MSTTLLIDTSYGSTVGILGYEPIVETDSRTHVERLQVDIDRAFRQVGHSSDDLERIIIGVGPAPYTGLRVGIVAAKALAFATGAELIGVDALTPQTALVPAALANVPGFERFRPAVDSSTKRTQSNVRRLTLAVNDARRKQLYFALFDSAEPGAEPWSCAAPPRTLIDMDIDTPDRLVDRVNDAVVRVMDESAEPLTDVVVDVVGHGVERYAEVWPGIQRLDACVEGSVLDAGSRGLDCVAACAEHAGLPVEPLYLRRPDVSVPNPLKRVIADGAEAAGERR